MKSLVTDNITIPDDAQLFILDQDGLVYRAANQKLFSLNTLATFFWICLEEGDDPQSCINKAAETFSLPVDTARDFFEQAVEIWNDLGLIGEQEEEPAPKSNFDPRKLTPTDGMPDLPDRNWEHPLQVSLIDCHIDVFAEKPEFLDGVRQILDHLVTGPDRTVPAISTDSTIHICQLDEAIGVYRDREPVAVFTNTTSIGPTVKSIVLQMSIDASDLQFYFHAGLLSTGEQLIMLPGEQGAGKSTLTTGLMLDGFEYFTDEVTLLNPENPLVRPFPIALCSKSQAWELLEPRLPALGELPIYHRLDGKLVRYLPPPDIDPHNPEYDRRLPIGYMVFPKYGPDSQTALQPISRAEALQRLMVECLAIRSKFTSETVQLLVDWIKGIECYTLTNNSLDEAVASVRQMVGQTRTP